MKDIHPKTKKVTFKCATCGKTYDIDSTIKEDVVSIDVCANCHPFFVGKAGETVIRGRAEKLAAKFNVQQVAKTEKKQKVSKKKIITSLDQLAK